MVWGLPGEVGLKAGEETEIIWHEHDKESGKRTRDIRMEKVYGDKSWDEDLGVEEHELKEHLDTGCGCVCGLDRWRKGMLGAT